MARVKRGTTNRARHKKVLKLSKGYFGRKSLTYKVANQAVMKSLSYAYRDRKAKKRDFRKLWITRINAACRLNEISYSQFIHGLKLSGIELDRKALADIAVNDAQGFTSLVNEAKTAIANKETVSA